MSPERWSVGTVRQDRRGGELAARSGCMMPWASALEPVYDLSRPAEIANRLLRWWTLRLALQPKTAAAGLIGSCIAPSCWVRWQELSPCRASGLLIGLSITRAAISPDSCLAGKDAAWRAGLAVLY